MIARTAILSHDSHLVIAGHRRQPLESAVLATHTNRAAEAAPSRRIAAGQGATASRPPNHEAGHDLVVEEGWIAW